MKKTLLITLVVTFGLNYWIWLFPPVPLLVLIAAVLVGFLENKRTTLAFYVKS